MRMRTQTFLVALAVGATSSLVAGCNTNLKCGNGTEEVNGECQVGNIPMAKCGPGEIFDTVSGLCQVAGFVQDAAAGLCGPNTVLQVSDAGVPTCVGTGMVGCATAPPCPAPSGGKTTICGRIFDTETSQPIGDGAANPAPPLEVRFYDPLQFVQTGPSSKSLLTVDVDQCGYYVGQSIAKPADGFIAAAVTDSAASGNTDFLLTGVATAAAGNDTIRGQNTFATRKSTVNKWDPQIGGTAGDLANKGIYVPIFIDDRTMPAPATPKLPPFRGTPQAGVTVTKGGTAVTTNIFCFDDTDPLTRKTLGMGKVSKTNGTCVLPGAALDMYSGMGAEPAGCTWPSTLAGTYAIMPSGVVFVQERNATCM